MWKTLGYITLINLFSAISLLPVGAQNAKKSKAVQDTVHVAFYNGIRAEIDISPIVKSFLSKETYSYEGSLQANILKKYFPVLELGYAGADKTTSEAVNFQTSGAFARLGVDFNLMKPKKDAKPTNNLFLAGVRLGFSSFNYDITNIQIYDSYWNENTIKNFNDINANKFWMEITGGVHVEVAKNIFMGWTARYKNMFGKPETGVLSPWYVPGFGINSSGNVWDLTYSIGYNF